ncbi:MAG TPA: glutaminase A [Cyanothece sp. UBA12306]|nr:glutaminase A [Cyanothece sp. UBA12306]
MVFKTISSDLMLQAHQKSKTGQLPQYIPCLSEADPQWLAVAFLSIDNQLQIKGDSQQIFPLMSVIKPFVLLYLLEHLGEKLVFERVGNKSSDLPFNSLSQLEIDDGFPRNPMINSGAITLASFLIGKNSKLRAENICFWLNQKSNSKLFLSETVLNSVRSLSNPLNQAIVEKLTAKGVLENPELALDTYNHICCLSGTVIDLVRLGLLLVKGSDYVLLKHYQIVSEIMTTSGLYEASADFAAKVGLPTKSGVSGAVLSLIPEQGAIATYSPPLNSQGNSVAGLWLVEQLNI